MDPSEELIRSSEIPREPSYQKRLQSSQRFISYCAISFMGEYDGKWLGAKKKIYGRIAQSHSSYVENKCAKKFITYV